MTHKRKIRPMLLSVRCGAKTRSGGACKSPAVQGRSRCRMHGGAGESGAPLGNTNARKHGLYTREAIAERGQVQALLRQSRKVVAGIK
jgi:hypothetical protein